MFADLLTTPYNLRGVKREREKRIRILFCQSVKFVFEIRCQIFGQLKPPSVKSQT